MSVSPMKLIGRPSFLQCIMFLKYANLAAQIPSIVTRNFQLLSDFMHLKHKSLIIFQRAYSQPLKLIFFLNTDNNDTMQNVSLCSDTY
jgi:hypothetical protein